MVDVSNALGPNWPSFLALLIVLFGIVWSEHRKRFRERHAPYLSFFNDTATTEIYTLSLNDALPI